MFTLIQQGRWSDLLLVEGPALVLALGVAEIWFKFHSLVLESVGFLAVWYGIGALAHLVHRWVGALRK